MGREVSIVFAGFSVNDTDKLIRKMSERLKLKPGCSMFLPEKYFCEDKTVCHSYFTDENGGVKKGGYFMSGSAEMIIAANDSDAVRNISWLKTEGTRIMTKTTKTNRSKVINHKTQRIKVRSRSGLSMRQLL